MIDGEIIDTSQRAPDLLNTNRHNRNLKMKKSKDGNR